MMVRSYTSSWLYNMQYLIYWNNKFKQEISTFYYTVYRLLDGLSIGINLMHGIFKTQCIMERLRKSNTTSYCTILIQSSMSQVNLKNTILSEKW